MSSAEELPLADALALDQVCLRFERAWQNGQHPRIEEYLAGAAEDRRPSLYTELLAIELELRQEDKPPALAEYQDRFPQYAGLTAAAFRVTPAVSRRPEIPGYRIIGELGRGGMGIVYQAEEIALGRPVAIKVFPQHLFPDTRHRQRFEREAQAAARLHHTNIVPVFRVGEHEELPYYVMQYIRGRSLNVVIAEQRAHSLPPPRRGREKEHPPPPGGREMTTWYHTVARLGVQAASALDFAHQHGILHRDVKPSNLLLDEDGTLWVADFGLAKLDEQDGLTGTHDLVGTLRYMPPEAFEGRYGPRGDLYALGLTLYELLGLQPAFPDTSRAALVKQITSAGPRRLNEVNPAIPRDLVTIVHKAIEYDAARRYASAGELAADLRRFLDDEPIRARRAGPGERLLRWARRNRAVALLSAMVFVTLLVGTVLSSYFAVAARYEAGQKREEAEKAQQAEAVARLERDSSDLRAARLKFREAVQQAEAGNVDLGLSGLIEALRLAPRNEQTEDFRRVVCLNFAAWRTQLPRLRYVLRLAEGIQARQTWVRPLGTDGRRFATWTPGQALQQRELSTGRPIDAGWKLADGEWPLAVDPEGTQVLCRTDVELRHTLCFRDLATGRQVGPTCPVPHLQPKPAIPGAATRVLDSRHVLTGQGPNGPWYGPRRFWDLTEATQYPYTVPAEAQANCRLAYSDKGDVLALVVWRSGGGPRRTEQRLEFLDLETGKPVEGPVRLRPGGDPYVGWDGRTVMSVFGDELWQLGGEDGSVRWWDTATGDLLDRWQPRRGACYSILLPAGQTLVSYGLDDRIRLYDPESGLQRGGDLAVPGSVHVTGEDGGAYPDEPLLLTWTADGLLHAWDTRQLRRQATAAASPRTPPASLARPSSQFPYTVFSPSGRLALVSGDNVSEYGCLVDTADGKPVGVPLRQPSLHHVAFRPDERRMAVAPLHYWDYNVRPVVHFLDVASGRPYLPPLSLNRFHFGLAFSPNGRVLAVGCLGGTVLVDAETGEILQTLPESTVATALVFSPDGATLAVGYRGGWDDGLRAGVRLWDVATGRPLTAFQPLGDANGVPRVHFQQDGRSLLVLQGARQPVLTGDPRTGPLRPCPLPSGWVSVLGLHPGGRRLAIGSETGTVTQWDFVSGSLVGEPMQQPCLPGPLEYSPDGKLLAIAGQDHAVRLWDSATGLPAGPPLYHAAEVTAIRFLSDGKSLVTVTIAGTLRRWPLPEAFPDDPERLELWIEALQGRRPTAGDTRLLSPDQWQQRCQELRERWPEAEAERLQCLDGPSSCALDVSWHEVRANEAGESGNLLALRWHLDHLARLRPEDWHLQARRGSALAFAGEPGEAEAAYTEAARKGGANELSVWYLHEAARAGVATRWELARWYYDRYLTLRPDDRDVQALRQEATSREHQRPGDSMR